MIIEHKRLDLYGKMVFERAIIQAPFTKPYPMDDEACFLFVKKGGVANYTEMETIIIHANEGIMMKCGNYLAKMMSDAETGTYEAMAVHFYPEVLTKVYENELPTFLKKDTSNKPPLTAAKLPSDSLFQKFFDGMLYYFTHPELVNEELIILKLKEILLLLNNTRESEKLRTILANLFSPQHYSFKQIIEAHILDDLSLADLAVLTGQSLSAFKRHFQDIYQTSPAKYIRNRRLERSIDLLEKTELTIAQIAYKCGFNDQGHFSKLFRVRYNQSPKTYRESLS